MSLAAEDFVTQGLPSAIHDHSDLGTRLPQYAFTFLQRHRRARLQMIAMVVLSMLPIALMLSGLLDDLVAGITSLILLLAAAVIGVDALWRRVTFTTPQGKRRSISRRACRDIMIAPVPGDASEWTVTVPGTRRNLPMQFQGDAAIVLLRRVLPAVNSEGGSHAVIAAAVALAAQHSAAGLMTAHHRKSQAVFDAFGIVSGLPSSPETMALEIRLGPLPQTGETG